MALVIDLKPRERIIVGEAVITNDEQRTRLHIEGDAPILRQKDVLRPAEADTPCKRIYLTIQLMYLSKEPGAMHNEYFEQLREVVEAAPSMKPMFLEVNTHIIGGQYYKALKEARKIIAYEEELMNRARGEAMMEAPASHHDSQHASAAAQPEREAPDSKDTSGEKKPPEGISDDKTATPDADATGPETECHNPKKEGVLS